MSGSDQIKKLGSLKGAREPEALERPQGSTVVDRAPPLAPSAAVKPLSELEASGSLDRLKALDQEHLGEVAQLISQVDQGERDAQEAWDELLRLALTSSLSVPSAVAEQLLPRLKALLESDPEAAAALKKRLGL